MTERFRQDYDYAHLVSTLTHGGFDKVSTVALGFDRFRHGRIWFRQGAHGFDRRGLVSTGGFDMVRDRVIHR